MTTLLLISWVAVLVALLGVTACRPQRTRHSWFELNRHDNKEAIRRERLLGDVLAIRRVVSGLLLVALVFLGLAALQTSGVLLSLAAWLCTGMLARWQPVHRMAMRLYKSQEARLLNLCERFPVIGKLFRAEPYIPRDQHVESVEHLLHLVDSAGSVLSDEQRELLRRGARWHTTTVEDIMIPMSKVVTVKHNELLGPLVLDDLHKSGHYRFPVVKGSDKSVIGILDITDSLEVSTARHSETVEKSMSGEALTIESDELLPTALGLLQKSRQHMLIVVDVDGKTLGVVTLADIASSLLGKNRGEMVQ